MCNRLGKKHRQYVGTEGLERLKKERLNQKLDRYWFISMSGKPNL